MSTDRSEGVSPPPDAGGHRGLHTTPPDVEAVEPETWARRSEAKPQAPAVHRPVGSMDKDNGALASSGLGALRTQNRGFHAMGRFAPGPAWLWRQNTARGVVAAIASVAALLVAAIALASLFF